MMPAHFDTMAKTSPPRATRRRARGFSMVELLVVVTLIGVVSAIAVPMFGNAIRTFRLSGDARGVANAVALAKMRASSVFSRARIYVDLSSDSYQLQTWSKASATCCWVLDNGAQNYLSDGVAFGFGIVATPPPNTQGVIGQAALCKNDAATSDIANTACVIFNSRGTPIDWQGNPTVHALYVTDGTAVFGVTLSATGMIRTWRTQPVATPTWVVQ